MIYESGDYIACNGYLYGVLRVAGNNITLSSIATREVMTVTMQYLNDSGAKKVDWFFDPEIEREFYGSKRVLAWAAIGGLIWIMVIFLCLKL